MDRVREWARPKPNERTKKFALGRKKKVGQKRDRGGGRRWGNLSWNGHFIYRDYIEGYVVRFQSQIPEYFIFGFKFGLIVIFGWPFYQESILLCSINPP